MQLELLLNVFRLLISAITAALELDFDHANRSEVGELTAPELAGNSSSSLSLP